MVRRFVTAVDQIRRYERGELGYDCLGPSGFSDGVAEGLNSKIMAIKRKACGYRNRDHFKTAIYFFCGGLDLYPTNS